MRRKSPSEDRLILELNTQNYTHKPQKSNHLKALQEIANSWVQHGYYSDTGRAYQALIEGVIE